MSNSRYVFCSDIPIFVFLKTKAKTNDKDEGATVTLLGNLIIIVVFIIGLFVDRKKIVVLIRKIKMHISINHDIKSKCPNLHLSIIECTIINTSYNEELWKEIDKEIQSFQNKYVISDINKIPIIKATREAYKKCGKDPNRYRPSSEALSRRIINGKGLYQINTGVDIINLISFKTGYSIGAFDAQKIIGDITYNIGQKNEIYNGIGRGLLNVEGLPILRDEKGGIGTPTSDEERTKLSLGTTSLLVNINGYLGKQALIPVVEKTLYLLKKHLQATNISVRYIGA